MENSRFRNAFTLAEVLIVLGILGIIAAMTIPTLVNNVQKHEYVVALKKFYATQNNGWKQILADEGVEELEDTSVFQSIIAGNCSLSAISDARCSSFFDNLNKYFKFTPVTAPNYQLYFLNGTKTIDDTGIQTLAFADGSVMFSVTFFKVANPVTPESSAAIAAGGGHLYERMAMFYIDVNGFKGPNTYGRDIFRFMLSNDAILYPYYGKDFSLFDAGDLSYSWLNNSSYCGTSDSNDISSALGVGCAARIMEEGWEMNY